MLKNDFGFSFAAGFAGLSPRDLGGESAVSWVLWMFSAVVIRKTV
jgi:hypothetical protein